jgi:recombinational DNA repair ATPase RecF
VAHLDVARRTALFEAVGAVGAQAWFSGTDHDDFEGLDAQSLSISAGGGTASIT